MENTILIKIYEFDLPNIMIEDAVCRLLSVFLPLYLLTSAE